MLATPPQTWQIKRQHGRKRAMVLVDVRLLWILGSAAAGGLLYAGWVNIGLASGGVISLTADQAWRQQVCIDVNLSDFRVPIASHTHMVC
jgi:hypothetical protein